MGSRKHTPTINKSEFDAIARSLRSELKHKYDAAKQDADRPPANAETDGAFDHLPDLDSKTVARWSPVVKKYIGCKLDPSLIRRGGYDSFGDFWAEMAPRLRATCSDAPVTAAMSDARPSP